jgi:predicted nucleic-acid-binding protein
MTGLDTNVLVRFLMQDDPEQAAAASALMSGLTEAAPPSSTANRPSD